MQEGDLLIDYWIVEYQNRATDVDQAILGKPNLPNI